MNALNIKDLYVIKENEDDNDGELLFWNNYSGWGGILTANVFTKKQTEIINLPLDGRWIKLTEGITYVINWCVELEGMGS